MSSLRLVAAGIRDAVRGARGRPPYLVPIVAEPGQTALFTDPEVKAALMEQPVPIGYLVTVAIMAVSTLFALAPPRPRHSSRPT